MCFMIDLNVTGFFVGSGAAVIGTSSAADPAPTARTGSGAEPQRGPARRRFFSGYWCLIENFLNGSTIQFDLPGAVFFMESVPVS